MYICYKYCSVSAQYDNSDYFDFSSAKTIATAI